MSTWPVASGVLVEDGVAYFAAGIVNYDGSHVYALDAKSGRIIWQNNTSGHLESEARTGVSVQGHLLISDGKLYLAGGTSVSPAVYDLASGECLNDPSGLGQAGSTAVRGQELYKLGDRVVAGDRPLYADPEYPVYDNSVFNKLVHTSGASRDVVWVNDRQILCVNPISTNALNNSATESFKDPKFMMPGSVRLKLEQKPLWEREFEGSRAFVRCKNAILVAGTWPRSVPAVQAVDIRTGKNLWSPQRRLSGNPVRWGMAVDGDGYLVITLEGGEVLCFGPST
jgi:outer membrane protein assembly factor BamB